MIRRKSTLILAIGLVLVAAALLANTARAAGGCFTDTAGHWAETFICWLKNNNLSSGYPDGSFRPNNTITRAEVAVLLNKQVEIPPSQGQIFINIGASDWRPSIEYSNSVIMLDVNSVELGVFGTGSSQAIASPTIPVSMYGRNLALSEVIFCYTVDHTRGYLDDFSVIHYTMGIHGGFASVVFESDNVNRTDLGCRKYYFDTPVVLDQNSRINIVVTGFNTSTGPVVMLGRTTLVLTPTTQSTNLTP